MAPTACGIVISIDLSTVGVTRTIALVPAVPYTLADATAMPCATAVSAPAVSGWSTAVIVTVEILSTAVIASRCSTPVFRTLVSSSDETISDSITMLPDETMFWITMYSSSVYV